jgi:hypothetical protein
MTLVYIRLVYSVRYSVVPINSSLLTTTLDFSVIITQDVQSVSWHYKQVRLYLFDIILFCCVWYSLLVCCPLSISHVGTHVGRVNKFRVYQSVIHAVIRQKLCYYGNYVIAIWNNAVVSTPYQFYVNYRLRLCIITPTCAQTTNKRILVTDISYNLTGILLFVTCAWVGVIIHNFSDIMCMVRKT